MSNKIETIVAPYLLRPGQNFYDQNPFRDLILGVLHRGISLVTVRSGLSNIADVLANANHSEITTDDTHRAVYRVSKKPKVDEVDMNKYSAFNALRRDLSKYPGIMEYIGAHISPGTFSLSGEISQIGRAAKSTPNIKMEATDTYAWWAARRQTRLMRDYNPEVLNQEVLRWEDIRELLDKEDEKPFMDKSWMIMVNE